MRFKQFEDPGLKPDVDMNSMLPDNLQSVDNLFRA
jgi:hypothetical protein